MRFFHHCRACCLADRFRGPRRQPNEIASQDLLAWRGKAEKTTP